VILEADLITVKKKIMLCEF